MENIYEVEANNLQHARELVKTGVNFAPIDSIQVKKTIGKVRRMKEVKA